LAYLSRPKKRVFHFWW